MVIWLIDLTTALLVPMCHSRPAGATLDENGNCHRVFAGEVESPAGASVGSVVRPRSGQFVWVPVVSDRFGTHWLPTNICNTTLALHETSPRLGVGCIRLAALKQKVLGAWK